MKSKMINRIVGGLVIIYFVYCVYFLYTNRFKHQWDFQMQYSAAHIFSEGKNPYDAETMKAYAGNTLWYAYPPATLLFYRLFTFMPYDTAYGVYLLLKAAAIVGLVWLWQRKFIGAGFNGWFYLLCMLAFNGAIFLDMRSGNINMFEELMLWLGFYFFLEGRLIMFCLFILLAGSFKMTPAVFLVLLLFTGNKKKLVYLAGSCVVFACYLLIQFAISPDFFSRFVAGATNTLTERGVIAPSTLSMTADLLDLSGKSVGINVPPLICYIIDFIVAATVLFLSVRAYFVLVRQKAEDRDKIVIFTACLVYAIIHPRMKDYAYVLLIAPSFYIICRAGFSKMFPFLLALSILSTVHITLPGLVNIYAITWAYWPLLIAYLMWGLSIFEIYNSDRRRVEAG